MNALMQNQANAIIMHLPNNQERLINEDNVYDRVEESLQRFYDSYSIMPESKFNKHASFVSDNKLIYLGRDVVDVCEEAYIREIYASNSKPEFFEVLLKKQNMMDGSIEFESVDYNELVKSIPSMSDDPSVFIGMESAYEDTEFDDLPDDYEFATEADATIEDTTEKPEGFDEAQTGPNNNAGTNGNGGVEDITKTTAQALGEENDDNQDGNADGDDTDGFDDNGEGGEQPPDIMDENEDDSKDSADDEGTDSKKRIRLNMVKLHNIIKDSLDAMGTFTPDYGIEISRRYYKVQENLSTVDEILLRIINEQINDIPVEELMKKYTTLCNIYDISVRALRSFANEYNVAIRKKH